MQLWSAMPVIDLTGRSLHYLYSSWFSVTPYALPTLLNQFSNFVGCLSCNCGTDKQMLLLMTMSSQSSNDAPYPWVLNHASGCLLDQSQSFGRVESTQPLGVRLGLAVRINNQYSHPVCKGRCMDDYTTINDTREILQKTTYLLRNIDMGTREFVGMGYCVDNVQRTWMDESQMKMSSGVTQVNHTNELHKTR